ncbi:hypothetical protein N0V95_003094 [Ascochyta clinopodiicola]|nr:hypothetical protein N0V95_003094 [Ascochyta clinopodiicola]
MENLPQELVDQVCYFLERDDLKTALLISRRFQYAAEQASGAFACFTLKNNNVKDRERFLATFCTHRSRYLRKVEIYTSFPALEPRRREQTRQDRKKKRMQSVQPESGSCRESLEALREKDETFTSQIAEAFKAIRMVEDAGRNNAQRIQLTVFTPTRKVHECYCNHLRYCSWRVHLLSPDKLPKLLSVQALSICNPQLQLYIDNATQSRIDLRTLVDLAATCPNVEYLGCKLGADQWTSSADPVLEHFKHDHAGNLRDTRNHFADAIRDVNLPVSLQQVQLDFINDIDEAISEQRRPQPDLIYPRTHDSFSSSLRLLSANLRKIELRVMVDESLFWPHDSSTASSWPNLESLNVMFHIRSPSGLWYFQGPSGEGKRDKGEHIQEHLAYPPLDDGESDEDWHHASAKHPCRNLPTFRVVPINDMMEPFLESFARAVASMPRLKEVLLWAPLVFHPDDGEGEESDDGNENVVNGETEPEDNDENVDKLTEIIKPTAIALYPDDALAWGIAYVAPSGLAFDMGQDKSPYRQLWWRVGQWRPSKELHEIFQKIGETQASIVLKEFWTDSQYGEGLVAREWFSGESFFRSVWGRYPAYF